MSQTRRKGVEILRDELTDIIRVVGTHSQNITRRLERVRDLTNRHCGAKASLAVPVDDTTYVAPAEAAPGIPSRTVGLSTITEETEANLANSLETSPKVNAAANAATAAEKAKGPVSWSDFRSKVGEGTNLKTGRGNTLSRISTLWKQTKEGKPVGEIEAYLRNELKIQADLAAQKAPELEQIARRYTNKAAAKPLAVPRPTLTKRKTKAVNAPLNAAGGVAPAPLSKRVTATRKKVAPVAETDEEFWQRMNANATAHSKKVTNEALAMPEQRKKSQALAAQLKANHNAKGLAATPLKSRPVSLAPIPTLVPSKNKPFTVTNPTTGEQEELDL
jgi:hypothetical protein